jgi:glycosyltransferase involved in cell wall biosynthesis
MNVLYLCNLQGVGGVETLMLRIAKNSGDNIALLSTGKFIEHDLLSALETARIPVFNLHRSIPYNLLFGTKIETIYKIINKFQNDSLEVIYTFCTLDLLLALALQSQYFPNAKVLQGIYHPKECSWQPNKFNFLSFFFKFVFKKMPYQNLIFMNEECRDSHLIINKSIKDSQIIPLPVDTHLFSTIIRKPTIGKIISVGRITNFKTYNFTLLPIIKELITKGYKCEYHIYGHGEQEQLLIDKINELGLKSNVFFHGKTAYSKYQEILQDAFIFIGMGTAIVEASSAGVPSLLAIAGNNNAETYGWFCDIDNYSVGEPCQGLQTYQYLEKITSVLLDQTLYNKLEVKSKITAQKFELTTNLRLFNKAFLNAKVAKFKRFTFRIIAFGILIDKIIFNKILRNEPNIDRYKI